MKIPAIRAKLGNWTYYISSLSFLQVSQLVKRIDDELHKSESLRDQIQRSISDNYKHIATYILNQEDRFFNSLVLAVYDGQPQWVEVEMSFGDEDFHQLGFLELNGSEKIFPVDGQHRVEGIKAVLRMPEISDSIKKDCISVLFIGHQKTEEGMQKTRRLFTTLNRYARPVKLNDIIALDEDDTVAIATRELLENVELFSGKRVNNSEQKAIPESDKVALTSLIALYECNLEIYKVFIKDRTGNNPTKLFLYEKQKHRPNEADLQDFINYCKEFWLNFANSITAIRDYLKTDSEPAKKYRNTSNGGNLLFRPIGLLPFVQCVFDVSNRVKISYLEVLQNFDRLDLTISEKPWKMVVWNPLEKTMIMGNKSLIKLLLVYLYDRSLLSRNELRKLKDKYAVALNRTENVENSLEDLD